MANVSSRSPVEWQPCPATLSIHPEEAHLWRARLHVPDSTVNALRRWLSDDELARADRFLRKVHGHRFTQARATLRAILGAYLDCAPEAVRFVYGDSRKPRLDPDAHAKDLRFNVSHSRDRALFGLTVGRDIGVDIEAVDKRVELEKLARRFFASAEVAVLTALPPQARTQAFYDCWTRKEAFVKARGDGLKRALNSFVVSLEPDAKAAVLRVDDPAVDASQWTMRDVQAFEGYAAAVAIDGQVKAWRHFDMDTKGMV